MTELRKFDYKKLERLNDPERVKIINPDIIWETLNLSTPRILIDLGAGTGFFAALFYKKMKQGKIYACDTSEIMVDWINEHISKDYSDIIPTKCKETALPFSSGIADLAYLINVFHELENPNESLAEVYRVLKKKGKVAIIDWKPKEISGGSPLSLRISESIVYENLSKAGFSNIKNNDVLPYHYFFIAER